MQQRHHILDFVRVMGLDRRDAEAERVKAAVPAAGTSGEDYSDLDGFAGLDELRTAIERRLLPERMGAVRVPFRTAVPFQGDAATGYWVSETGPKPVGRFSATGVALPSRKVEALAAVTKDLLRSPSPDADAAILRILRNAVVRRVNATFASSDAAVDGEAPAGIGAGATGAGDPAQIVAGLEAVVEAADTADTDLTAAEWILSPAHAVEIAAAIGTDRLGLRGGELFGAPAHTDPAAETVYLVDPTRLALAVGSVDIEVARHASLEMDDDPQHGGTSPTAANLVSMFQTNSVAFLVGVFVNWEALAGSVFALGVEES
jgi:hypothetical protein